MAQQNLKSASTPAQPWTVGSTTLRGTDSSGNTYSVTYSETPGGMAMFNGQNANTSTITLSISRNGVLVATESSTAYYLTNPFSPLGVSGNTAGTSWTAVITSYTPLPTTLMAGTSGPFSAATYYDGMNHVIGSLTQTYSVREDSPTALFLDINGTGSLNGVQETETLTFAVAANGTIAALTQAQITVNGTTLIFH